jgi:hypothetical protein
MDLFKTKESLMRMSAMIRGVLCLSFFLATVTAKGGLEPRWFLTFPTPEGMVCHAYHLWLVAGALQPGAAFPQHITFYDVQNLLPLSTPPADWAVSIQARGVDANDVAMRGRDDTNRLMNVTWTWTGTARVEGPVDLGSIRICSAGPPDSGISTPYRYVSQTSGPLGPTALVGFVRGTRYP